MQIRIKGYTFQLAEPFQPGTVITKGEAQALNDLRAENIQNNLRKLVADATAELSDGHLLSAEVIAEIQRKISLYDSGYQFVEKHTPRPRIGDIEVEARAIARERVDADLRKSGRNDCSVDDEEFEQLVATTEKLPAVLEAARDRVLARRRALSDGLADL